MRPGREPAAQAPTGSDRTACQAPAQPVPVQAAVEALRAGGAKQEWKLRDRLVDHRSAGRRPRAEQPTAHRGRRSVSDGCLLTGHEVRAGAGECGDHQAGRDGQRDEGG